MPDDGLGSDLTPGPPQRAVERVERVSRLCRDLHCPVSLHGREVYYISASRSTRLERNRAIQCFPAFSAVVAWTYAYCLRRKVHQVACAADRRLAELARRAAPVGHFQADDFAPRVRAAPVLAPKIAAYQVTHTWNGARLTSLYVRS